MLGIDEDGRTTARKLYDFLQMHKSHYSRWVKKNIKENLFATENADFIRCTINDETPTGGKIKLEDFKLTASFAKKLCMTSQSKRGEQARNYFIKVEDNLKKQNKYIKSTQNNQNIMFLAQNMQQMALNMSQFMQNTAVQMQQIKEETKKEVKGIVKDSIIVKDEQINQMADMIGIHDGNTKYLVNTLKDKLSEMMGYKITAKDYIYEKVRRKIFKKFRVVKWEDINIGRFNAVFAYIDSLEKEDIGIAC